MSAPHRWVPLALFVVAVLAAIEAAGFRVSFPTDPIGPRAFPWLACALVALGTLGSVRRGFRGRGGPDLSGDMDAGVGATDDPGTPGPVGLGPIAFATVAFAGYALLLAPLGFFVATALVFTALGRLFRGAWGRSALSGVAVSGLLYVLFAWGLGLPLPAGVWLG